MATPGDTPHELPTGYLETGRITIVVGLSPEGSEDSGFTVSGLNMAHAIGQLTTTLDRIRADQQSRWRLREDGDTDPQ